MNTVYYLGATLIFLLATVAAFLVGKSQAPGALVARRRMIQAKKRRADHDRARAEYEAAQAHDALERAALRLRAERLSRRVLALSTEETDIAAELANQGDDLAFAARLNGEHRASSGPGPTRR